MRYISFECGQRGTLDGGFGDRILGVASTLALCDKSGSKMLINWIDGKIDGFFDYQNFRYTEDLGNFHSISSQPIGPYVQNVENLKTYFSDYDFSNDNFFSDKNVVFRTNQNLWQSFFDKKDITSYETYTTSLLKRVFEEYLVPKEHISKKVSEIIDDDEHVGVQIRMGDLHMTKENPHIYEANDPNFYRCGYDEVANFVNQVISENPGRKIFITSDINIKRLEGLVDLSKVKYVDGTPTHLERSVDTSGLEKTYGDFFCLARCGKHYISKTSNFGRLAAILSGKNDATFIVNVGERLLPSKTNISEMSCKQWNK